MSTHLLPNIVRLITFTKLTFKFLFLLESYFSPSQEDCNRIPNKKCVRLNDECVFFHTFYTFSLLEEDNPLLGQSLLIVNIKINDLNKEYRAAHNLNNYINFKSKMARAICEVMNIHKLPLFTMTQSIITEENKPTECSRLFMPQKDIKAAHDFKVVLEKSHSPSVHSTFQPAPVYSTQLKKRNANSPNTHHCISVLMTFMWNNINLLNL